MAEMREIPVFLFTGFLDSGKTRFIQETLEDRRFCNGERTLLIVCEEGEEEYAPDQFADKAVFIRDVYDEKDLNKEKLAAWLKETNAERVVIEYNGMWMLDSLYGNMPENWRVYQEFFFADSATFLSYNANMRQLVYDKLKSCELAVFNRFRPEMDKMAFHKIVRGASRRADIAYESPEGNVVYDDIEDPLPFDVNASNIVINDTDYALFYRDLSENARTYDGKTVTFKARVLVRDKLPKGSVVVGRHVMTCCVEDIQFAALVCQWDRSVPVQDDSWIILTAKIEIKFSRAYVRKGPVLTYISSMPSTPPDDPVATFY